MEDTGMKKRFLTKLTGIAVVTSLLLTATACSSQDAASDPGSEGNASSASSEASSERDTIQVSVGRQTLQNVTFPDGDTYEDNAYIRMAENKLNIDITDEFEAYGDDYDRQVSLALSAGDIPDMMKVATLDEVQELYENDLIADLTGVYEEYASDYLKSVYDSYEGRAMENVTFDGMMMALPGTNTDAGPSIVWIRSDWMEQLGMNIDEDQDGCITIEDVEMIAKEFMAKNPENAENVVGVALAPWLTSGDPDGTFSMNSIAYALGAFPKTWMEKDGHVTYGSITGEMKQALAVAAGWFQDGILDPQVGTRTWDDITALLANGQCGITFGTWHIPDWLLNNVYALNNNATFEAYTLADADGKVNCKHNNATNGYIVVSKDFEHPEIAIQIANLFYDELVNSKELLEEYPEVASYVANGVDGSSRPFNIEVNSYTSLLDDYGDLEKCLNGEITVEEVRTSEQRSNATSISGYLEGNGDATGWSKYHSRSKGVELIQTLTENDQFNWLTPIFPQTTPTMETNLANLEKLEEETFIKIVTGDIDVESGFEKFVTDWNKQGGEQIINEIAEQLQQ
ncbi:extracellular solute-binding protein [uncultured Phocaeicola sp.]|uniref:extracellular solute-binding protein n=1 Tax=uncultured Phocaeicola sp. TaxID=990718 RepID=UPI0025A21319|nr:extracellular solute-binding protein [uncultured Phocaeicola sp.]